MQERIAGRVVGLVFVGLAGLVGCADDKWVDSDESVAIDDDVALSEEAKLIGPGSGPRCTIRGEPPVTVGCTEDQTCLPYACTNSIPPSCVGFCQDAAPPPPKQRRCDVTGDPAVTTGCEAYETCAVEACTNSIPPHCWGHCE